MIINKTNLLVSGVVGKDKNQPILSTVHVTENGDTIACNGKAILAIEGVDKIRKESVPFSGAGEELHEAFTLPLDLVNKIIRSIPQDKQFDGLLEMIHINKGRQDGDLTITTHDGKGEKQIKGSKYHRQYVDFEKIADHLYFDKKIVARVILDRKRLLALLQTMDKVCGDTPTFIEITEDNDMLLRSYSSNTEQRVVAIMAGVKTEWEDTCDFTRSLSKKYKEKKVIRRRTAAKKRPVRRRKNANQKN